MDSGNSHLELRMLYLKCIPVCLVLVSCVVKKETKIVYVPQDPPRSETPSEDKTEIPEDFNSLQFIQISQVPQDIMNLSKRDFFPSDENQEAFLLNELTRFQCGLNTEYASSSCILPESVGELDYLWELGREVEMLGFNNKHHTAELNQKITARGSEIMAQVEAAKVYQDFQTENLRIKKKILADFDYSLSQVVTNGAIRMRVGLITLLQLKDQPSFLKYLEQKNVSTVFIHQTGMFSLSKDSLLLGWDLSISDVAGKL